ncbi:hypothetical protein HQQ80_04150 [Microbacteriaceae bacterium VKM Ac-2855]|nr:hypothetical protein [Microbacteriaceae bacterium VKM Ac-2855]
MNGGTPERSFRSRPRAAAPDTSKHQRQLTQLARLRHRLERATRDGEAAFVAEQSDTHDIGTLAIINLADFVTRELLPEIVSQLPPDAVQGLRRTRNIAAHEYAELDNGRLWLTVSVYAPALIARIEAALASSPSTPD